MAFQQYKNTNEPSMKVWAMLWDGTTNGFTAIDEAAENIPHDFRVEDGECRIYSSSTFQVPRSNQYIIWTPGESVWDCRSKYLFEFTHKPIQS